MTGRSFKGLPGTFAALAVLAFSGISAAADAPRQVTFSKDVAPIIQAKCQDCHQPNSIAPMSLISYKEVRPWARAIKDRVSTRQMPPWHIERSVGVQKFKNDMSLSDAQLDTIVKWVDQGALEGDPKDLPAPKPLIKDNEWQAARDGYGPPDLVVSSGEFTMPARHQDVWWRPVTEIPVTEPRWVRMVEIRPTTLKARQILHHSIAYLILNPNNVESVNTGTTVPAPGTANVDELLNRRPYLMEWAIGKGYDRFRDGTGRMIMPGEKISWEQHIHAGSEDISGGSEIGIWFYPKGQEPAKRSYLIPFTAVRRQPGAARLDIPPNQISRTEGFTVLRENTLFTNFQPHFHLRGKAMQVEAILPDGSTQIISYVDKFNFNWMTNYIYADDAAPAFPKGTIIHVSAYYDNTKANKFNPDPDQWVGYGDRTVDEMGHAWMNVVYLTDAEYQQWVAEHKTKAESTQNQQQ